MTAPNWLGGLADCCCDCTYFSDTFTRANGASLGVAEWTETDWTIASNKAATLTSNAYAIATKSSGDGYGVVQVVFSGATLGDEIKLIIAYLDDNNYVFALFKLSTSAGGCGSIKLYKRVAGVETQLGITRRVRSFENNTNHTLILCRSGNTVTGSVASTTTVSALYDQLTETFTGEKAGFRTGSIGAGVTVDNYSFSRFGTSVTSLCPTCSAALSCTIFEDTFDRTDSSDVGCEWDEIVGNWSIVSNALSVSTANAILTTEQTHPDGRLSYGLAVVMRMGTVDYAARLLINYVDTNNYWYGEVNFMAGTDSAIVSIGKVEGGVTTVLDKGQVFPVGGDTNYNAVLSVYDGVVTFEAFDSSGGGLVNPGYGGTLKVPAPTPFSLKVGLGSVLATGTTFQSAQMIIHGPRPGGGTCDEPGGNCGTAQGTPAPCIDGDVPYYLQVELDFTSASVFHPFFDFCNAPLDFDQFNGVYMLERGIVLDGVFNQCATGKSRSQFQSQLECCFGGVEVDLGCGAPANGQVIGWTLGAHLLYRPHYDAAISSRSDLFYDGVVIEIVIGFRLQTLAAVRLSWIYKIPPGGTPFTLIDCTSLMGEAFYPDPDFYPFFGAHPESVIAYEAVDLP